MRNKLMFAGCCAVVGVFLAAPGTVSAYEPITYRYRHFLFEIDPDHHPSWRSTEELWTYEGQPIVPAASLRVDGDDLPPLPPGIVRSSQLGWDTGAIRAALVQDIARHFDRAAGSVVIRENPEGVVLFEGVGFIGRRVRIAEAARLTIDALESGVTDIVLPVQETQPQISLLSPRLRDLGITEVLAVGESDFRGSPAARQHNIEVGLRRFSGHLIGQGDIFSFNEVLGPVDATTGYKKELVIKGDKTLPDYGGGLCQVSTTAYRGIWEYGFPIEERRNHSYSVRYYSPVGTDATIYPPQTDIRFLNDSPGAILMQTHTEDGRAYFVYYGTRDARSAEVMGPYVWDQAQPPDDKVEYTTDIAPGESRKVGERVPGLKAAWFRIVRWPGEEELIEPYYSYYEARPRFTQIGIAADALPSPDEEMSSSQSSQSSSRESILEQLENRYRRRR